MSDESVNSNGLSESEIKNLLYSAAEIYPFLIKADQIFSFFDQNDERHFFVAVENEDFPDNGVLADFTIIADNETAMFNVNQNLEFLDIPDFKKKFTGGNLISFQVIDTGKDLIGQVDYRGKLKELSCDEKNQLLLDFLKAMDEAVKGPDGSND